MPFQGQAIGTKGIFPGLSTVGKELPKMCLANRAFDLVANIKYGDKLQHPVAEELQVLSRDSSEQKADYMLQNVFLRAIIGPKYNQLAPKPAWHPDKE